MPGGRPAAADEVRWRHRLRPGLDDHEAVVRRALGSCQVLAPCPRRMTAPSLRLQIPPATRTPGMPGVIPAQPAHHHRSRPAARPTSAKPSKRSPALADLRTNMARLGSAGTRRPGHGLVRDPHTENAAVIRDKNALEAARSDRLHRTDLNDRQQPVPLRGERITANIRRYTGDLVKVPDRRVALSGHGTCSPKSSVPSLAPRRNANRCRPARRSWVS